MKAIVRLKEELKGQRQILLVVIFLAVLATIFPDQSISDILIFSLVGLYLFAIYLYKINSGLTFKFSLVLLIVMSVLFIFTGPSTITEKAAVWLYLFLGIGIMQQLKESI